MKVIKTRFVFEFEVDVEDFDPKYIDIEGMAKDLTIEELKSLFLNGDISAEEIDIIEKL